MSGQPLGLVASAPDWRAALTAAIRPEFRVAVYEADAEDRWLYGRHCAVSGCELPSHRPVNGRGGVYVCNGHLHNYRDHGAGDWQSWLAGVGLLRRQRRCGPCYRLAVGGRLEAELRYGLQCWHDGQHTVVARASGWAAQLRDLDRIEVDSLLDLERPTCAVPSAPGARRRSCAEWLIASAAQRSGSTIAMPTYGSARSMSSSVPRTAGSR